MTKRPTSNLPVSILALVAMAASTLYIGMEWLFFATKASFLDSFDWSSRLSSLFLNLTALAFITWITSLVLKTLQPVADRLSRHYPPKKKLHLEIWPTIFLITSTAFLMFDNFIYTLSPQLGVVRSNVVTRFFYLGIFIYFVIRITRWIEPQIASFSKNKHHQRIARIGAAAILLATLGLFASQMRHNNWSHFSARADQSAEIKKPNILFVATDGIEARAISAYGFKLKNTPFLEKLAKESLFFENAFTNAGKTTGSTVSMLSGISPFESKVGFPPQILSKQYAFRHLPAILKDLGYVGFQRTVRHYADGGDSNMQSGFAFANGRKLFSPMPHSLAAKTLYLFNAEYLFSLQLMDRLFSRLLHITALRPIVTHYLVVSANKGLGTQHDHEATDETIEFMRKQSQKGAPFFAHLHLQATHCCGYHGAPETFTKEESAQPNNDDRQNSAQARKHGLVKNADAEFGRIYDFLKESKLLENTIIIVTSDHSPTWDTVERLPLLMRFPNQAYRGRVTANTAFIDIPPTVLDYMQAKKPEWMSGKSRIRKENQVSSQGWIDSLSEFEYKRFRIRQGGHLSQMTNPGPPLYGVKYVAGIYCNQWKKLDLTNGRVWGEPVIGHTRPCPPDSIPSDAEFVKHEVNLLTKAGFKLPLSKWKPPYVDDDLAP